MACKRPSVAPKGNHQFSQNNPRIAYCGTTVRVFPLTGRTGANYSGNLPSSATLIRLAFYVSPTGSDTNSGTEAEYQDLLKTP